MREVKAEGRGPTAAWSATAARIGRDSAAVRASATAASFAELLGEARSEPMPAPAAAADAAPEQAARPEVAAAADVGPQTAAPKAGDAAAERPQTPQEDPEPSAEPAAAAAPDDAEDGRSEPSEPQAHVQAVAADGSAVPVDPAQVVQAAAALPPPAPPSAEEAAAPPVAPVPGTPPAAVPGVQPQGQPPPQDGAPEEIPAPQERAEESTVRVERPAFLDLLTRSEASHPALVADTQTPHELAARVQEALAGPLAPTTEAMDVLGQDLVPQVLRGLVTLVRGGTAEMRLQLQPPDLGNLELRVRTTQGMVHGEVLVQHEQVKHLLDAQIHRLRDALQQQGLHLRGLDVSVSHDPRRQATAEWGRPGAGGSGTPRRAPTAQPAAAAPQAVAVGAHVVDYTI